MKIPETPALHRIKINKRIFVPVYGITDELDGSLCRGYVPIEDAPVVTQEMQDAPVVLEIDSKPDRAILWIKFGESQP